MQKSEKTLKGFGASPVGLYPRSLQNWSLMIDYHIEVSATAEKQLRELEKADQQRIAHTLKGLALEPRPHGCRKLRAYDDVYRIRAGVFRVIYSVEDDRLLILVLKIGHRSGIYR